MKISVVTAVFNRVETIGQTLESVRSQTHEDVEHIVQDGGSTDGTLNVINQQRGGALHLRSEADDGLYDGINRGIRRATGNVIGLMHSDDFFAHPRVLSAVAERFADAQIDGVYGDLQYVAAGDTRRVIRLWRAGSYRPERLTRGWMPPHPTLYLRREVFERFGLYDTSYHISADYEAMLRYLIRGKIRLAYIPSVIVKMRMGGESNRSLGRILQKSAEDLRAVRDHSVGGIPTIALKNARKIGQFIQR